jgi:hypothetical protein
MAHDKRFMSRDKNPSQEKKATVLTNGKAIRPLSTDIDMSTMNKICRDFIASGSTSRLG